MEHISKAQIKWIRSLQHKKFRDELGYFVAEGRKCIEELKKGFELVLEVTANNATEVEIAQMSSLRHPQGDIAIFKKPIWHNVPLQEKLVVVLDGIQDPGNLGTIIRTCDWFGVHHVVCSIDTADCFNPKVVQATMGSLTRVQITYCDLPTFLEEQRNQGVEVFGTLLDGLNMYEELSHTKVEQQAIIVMGNEGNGISEEVRKWISTPLFIPSYTSDGETAESLNVAIATAVVLAAFRKQGK